MRLPRGRWPGCVLAFAAWSAATFATPLVRGDAQASLGLTTGAVVRPQPQPGQSAVALHTGARADVLLLRSKPSQMALGPYIDIATAAFRDVDLGGGAEWLLPVTQDLPLVLGAGALARRVGGAWLPGLEGSLFFGSRSYNYHSAYGMTAGLFTQGRWTLEPSSSFELVAGVRLDAEILLLPVLFLGDLLTD